MQINVVQPFQVDFFWPTIAKHIEASQSRGPVDMRLDEIQDNCRADERWRLLIFDHFEGAAVIRVWDDWLHVVAIGGHFQKGWEWEFFDYLKRLGRFIGAKYVTLGGRKGWDRKLAPLGFKHLDPVFLGVEIERELEP